MTIMDNVETPVVPIPCMVRKALNNETGGRGGNQLPSQADERYRETHMSWVMDPAKAQAIVLKKKTPVQVKSVCFRPKMSANRPKNGCKDISA